MPHAKITGVQVSHIWDDGSTEDIKLTRSLEGDDDPTVSLVAEGVTIYLRPESWPEIRDQIDDMFQEMKNENEESLKTQQEPA